jgi:endonuclease YncB( thermonuclease family)
MNLKTFLNAIALFIGLGLAAYSQLSKDSQSEQVTVVPSSTEREFERWNLKEGSIYDGDTLRVVRGEEELKIRFCGIDAPEKNQELGIEARDHLRSLIAQEMAQKEGLGIWQGNPQPHWEWRKALK